MNQFFLLIVSSILLLTSPVLSTDNDNPENEFHFKRKINNIENLEIPRNDKRLKVEDQGIVSYREYQYKQLNLEITENCKLRKLDKDFLSKKFDEFDSLCREDIKLFENESRNIKIQERERYLYEYSMLMSAIKEGVSKDDYTESFDKKIIFRELVSLRDACTIMEFCYTLKYLSSLYHNRSHQGGVVWCTSKRVMGLTLNQALQYIIYKKTGYCSGNIKAITPKSKYENIEILPVIMRNELPNIDKNVHVIYHDPVTPAYYDYRHPIPFLHNVHQQYAAPMTPVNNNHGQQIPLVQPLYNEGGMNNIGPALYHQSPVQHVKIENNNYMPQIPQNAQFPYAAPMAPVNNNYGQRIPLVQPLYNEGGMNNIGPALYHQSPVQHVKIENNNYMPQIPQNQYHGYQTPFPQQNHNYNIINNYGYAVPIPQFVSDAEIRNNRAYPLGEFQGARNNLKMGEHEDEFYYEKNLPNQNFIPNFKAKQKEMVTTQRSNSNSGFNSTVPTFNNVGQIRDFYKIREGCLIGIETLTQAEKSAKKLGDNLLPNNFRIKVHYPKSNVQKKEISISNFSDSLEDWNYLDKNMRLYIEIRDKAKELAAQNFLTSEVLRYVERNIIDIQHVLLNRPVILTKVKDMIKNNEFRGYFFNDNAAAIHIENGYLTNENIFQGVVDSKGSSHYDGVQIQDRLNTYIETYSQAYNLAVELRRDELESNELGNNALVRFFESFINAQCLDARIYPLQLLLLEMEQRKELIKSLTTANSRLSKQEALTSKFYEEYNKNSDEQENIIKNMEEFFKNKIFNDGSVNTQEISNFVKEKYNEIWIWEI